MIITQHASPNHDQRTLTVDMLLLHYTGMQTGQAALDRLCDPQWKVSSHYLVEEDGRVFQLVDEARRARHAGVSFWRGETDNNSRSVGIEIVNPGHEWGYRAFPEAQISAVIELSQAILSRHDIPAGHVVGHSDVAPDRKTDPGELFPWGLLAENGIGIAPPVIHEGGRLLISADGESEVAVRAQSLLSQIGYDVPSTGLWDPHSITNMTAFQRHFYPQRLDGLVDEGGLQALEMVARAVATVGRDLPSQRPDPDSLTG